MVYYDMLDRALKRVPGLMPGTLSARSRELRKLLRAFRYCICWLQATALRP